MEKVPHYIRLRLIINRTVKEWDLRQILEVLREELQARESCSSSGSKQEEEDHINNSVSKNINYFSHKETPQLNTASSLTVGTPSCTFCREQISVML